MEKVISSYADSLFNLALENGEVANVFKYIRDLLGDNDEVFHMISENLSNPIFSKYVKYKIIEDLTSNVYLRNFLKVVILNNRAKMLPSIFKKIIDLLTEYRGNVNVEIKSTILFQQKQLDEFSILLKNLLKKQPIIINLVDKSILGGFVITTNSLMIDMSYVAKLRDLKNWSFKAVSHLPIEYNG